MVKDASIDRPLLVVALLLVALGLLMVYSSTMIVAKQNYGDSYFFFKKQLVWLVIGLVVFFSLIFLRTPIYLNQKLILAFVWLTVLGLFLTFLGDKINNTYRWIRFAGLSVQPSEFAKIAVVLYLAFMLGKKVELISGFKNLLVVLLPVLVIEGLIIKEPDFGNFILIAIITLVMLFVSGLAIRYFLILAAALLPVLYILIRFNPERMNRVLSFLNPESFATTSGFQAIQSLYAIGSGGVFGQGIGNSTQKLFFLPYAYTDFIFAIVAEELGLIGAVLLIGLFTIFFFRGIVIARHSDNPHTYLLVIGLTMLVVLQALINISVTIGIFPTKGIPLPFISSGGTSLLCSLIVTAIILNVSRQRKVVFTND